MSDGRLHFKCDSPIDARSSTTTLSRNEFITVTLLSRGYTRQEIAQEAHVTRSRIQGLVANAMRKLGARTDAMLTAIAVKQGIVEPDP